MPFYAYHGRLIFFAAHKTHVGVYPIFGHEIKRYGRELKPYLAEKATLQFPIGRPIPVALLKRIVRERAKANEANAARPRVSRAKKAAGSSSVKPR